ncbi:hypothetical protein [Mycolicibacterium sp. CBMA 226]|nr:hypothetical protein [Mycolicibacterium sp. CBMA 226]
MVPKAATGDADVDKLRHDVVEPRLHGAGSGGGSSGGGGRF